MRATDSFLFFLLLTSKSEAKSDYAHTSKFAYNDGKWRLHAGPLVPGSEGSVKEVTLGQISWEGNKAGLYGRDGRTATYTSAAGLLLAGD